MDTRENKTAGPILAFLVVVALVVVIYCGWRYLVESSFKTLEVHPGHIGMLVDRPVEFEPSSAVRLEPGKHKVKKGKFFIEMKPGGEYVCEDTADVIPSAFGKWIKGARNSRILIPLIPGAAEVVHGEAVEHLSVPLKVTYKFPEDPDVAFDLMRRMFVYDTEAGIAVCIDSAVGLYGKELLAGKGGGGLGGTMRRMKDTVNKVIPGSQPAKTMDSELLAESLKLDLERELGLKIVSIEVGEIRIMRQTSVEDSIQRRLKGFRRE